MEISQELRNELNIMTTTTMKRGKMSPEKKIREQKSVLR